MRPAPARISRAVAGAVVLPLITVGLVTGCGKHSPASSSLKSSASHSSTSMKSSGSTGPKSMHSGACHPTSKKGNCYEPGEMCAKTQYRESGVAGDGKSITCKEVKGIWRWEAA